MSDPILQGINAMHNAEDNQAALDERIDQATDDAMKELTAGELLTALTEIDAGDVDQGRFKAGSAEDHFEDLLIYVRAYASSMSYSDREVSQGRMAKSLYNLVWKNHRALEIEPIMED